MLEKIASKFVKILVTSLATASIMSCTSHRTDQINVLYSKEKIDGVFGGVIDKYNPRRIKIEFEEEKENYSAIIAPFYAQDKNNDFEIGIDWIAKMRGPINRYVDFYTKGGAGFVYESKYFEQQDTRINFHLTAGFGFEFIINQELRGIIGWDWNHGSNGRSIWSQIPGIKDTFSEYDDNSGFNTVNEGFPTIGIGFRF